MRMRGQANRRVCVVSVLCGSSPLRASVPCAYERRQDARPDALCASEGMVVWWRRRSDVGGEVGGGWWMDGGGMDGMVDDHRPPLHPTEGARAAGLWTVGCGRGTGRNNAIGHAEDGRQPPHLSTSSIPAPSSTRFMLTTCPHSINDNLWLHWTSPSLHRAPPLHGSPLLTPRTALISASPRSAGCPVSTRGRASARCRSDECGGGIPGRCLCAFGWRR